MRYIGFIFALCLSIQAIASNTITLSSVSGTPQTEVEVVVSLDNTDAITALELNIPLGEHLSYVDGSTVLASSRSNGHLLTATQVQQELRICVYSLNLSALQGNSGELLSFRLKLGNEPAAYTLTPSVILSDARGQSLDSNVQSGQVNILAPKLEILNPQIDYGHIPIRETYTQDLQLYNAGNLPLIIENIVVNDPAFTPAQTALTIEVGEVAYTTIHYAPTVRGAIQKEVVVTSNAINGKQMGTIVSDPFSVNELHVVGGSGIADNAVTISIKMNNMEPIVGMQCTFVLPEQLEYIAGSLSASSRSNGHQALASVKKFVEKENQWYDSKGDTLVLMLYSMANRPLNGNDGEIATFQVRLNGNSGSYALTPRNVVLTNATAENMVSATYEGWVEIQSPQFSGDDYLSFGDWSITDNIVANYVVRNHGDAPLEIERVTFLAQGYRVVSTMPLQINPWEESTMQIAYDPAAEGDFSTTMNIYTNDPSTRMKAVAVSGHVYEPNTLSVDGERMQDGSYQLAISLDNYTNIVGVQYDIHWRSDMTTSQAAFTPMARLQNHAYTIMPIGQNTYRVLIYSISNTPITGKEGELHKLLFTPQGNVDYCGDVITIDNIVLSNANGTDKVSQSSVSLTINHNEREEYTIIACHQYEWHGQVYTESGDYEYFTTTAQGCERVEILHLTISDREYEEYYIVACDEYYWHDQTYYESGEYMFNTISESGCERTEVLKLTINKRDTVHYYETACNEYYWNHNWQHYHESGDYEYYTTNERGCERVEILHLTIHHSEHEEYYKTACDQYEWHGKVYTKSGEYEYHTTSEQGCERVEVLHLTINQTHYEETVTSCDSYTWNGETYTESGEYTYTSTTINGCERVEVLYLTINKTQYAEVSAIACDSYEWNGESYTESGEYNYTTTAANGCDSIITLHLTINRSEREEYDVTACDQYEWHGETYTQSGDYEYRSTLENGCERVEVLHLTIYNSQYEEYWETACDEYYWNGETYTESGEYTYSYSIYDWGTGTCDHTEVLHLTINKRDTVHYYETACNRYYWSNNGNEYLYSGDYENYTTNEYGCERVEILHLTINHSEHQDYLETACDAYEWHGNIYTESGDYAYRTTTEQGCERVEVLHLTIYNSQYEESWETACDEYWWHGNQYTESGEYTYSYPIYDWGTGTCDRTEVLHLTINKRDTVHYYETACDEYFWNQHWQYYYESGDYENYTTNEYGCERVEILHLTINRSKREEYWIKACDAYEWHGNTYTESGVYEYRTTTEQGCEHVEVLHLTINRSEREEYDVTACDQYEWHGDLYTESGVYEYRTNTTETEKLYVGYDSEYDPIIGLTPPRGISRFTVDGFITEGSGACFVGTGSPENGIVDDEGDLRIFDAGCFYYDRMSGRHDCFFDDFRYPFNIEFGNYYAKNLETGAYYFNEGNNVYEYSNTEYPLTLFYKDYGKIHKVQFFDNNNLLWADINAVLEDGVPMITIDYYNSDGTIYYTQQFTENLHAETKTICSCGRVEILHLTINNTQYAEETVTACDNYTWNGETYTESGEYVYNTVAANGCDSIVTLHLTINQTQYAEEAVTACDSYTWNGETYTESGEYTYTTTAANGCDSIVTLHLTINQSEVGDIEDATICYGETYTWNGQTYAATGKYSVTLTNAAGCDSIATLHLTIMPEAVTSTETVVIGSDELPYTWRGNTYLATGRYTDIEQYTQVDCDSAIHVLDLTVLTTGNFDEESITICETETPYMWYGESYTATGKYTYTKKYTGTDIDSVQHILNLTVNPTKYTEETITACDSYTWNGNTYTASGEYVYTTTAANGCDSIVTLHLTINMTQYAEETVVACDGYTWNGETYTESGEYVYTTAAANGCDSIVTLHLTINKTQYAEETVTACDSYVWNGERYTASGEYTYTTTAANGCDSIVTLHLTINKSEREEFTETACDSYVWNGVTYTESGDYTYTTTTAAGCERVEVLHLTINKSEHIEETVTACDEYYWDHNGETYYESGDYEYYTTTEQGCERVEVLHLTILPVATTESEEIALCPSELPYEWYGQWLTEEGTYSATEQYVGMECDSVIHELTLNVYVQTLPAAVTLPIVRTGEAIDVTTPTAEIQAHIAAKTWYAPNAEVAWYIMDNSDWAALSVDPVATGITEVTLKYVVDTDCGNVESDKMVINLKTTDMENTQSQSTTSNCRKVLYEDHIYILREDKIYNAMGQEL